MFAARSLRNLSSQKMFKSAIGARFKCGTAADPDAVQQMLAKNSEWRERMIADDPEYFSRFATSQAPEFLFIGCSDSRVSAELMTGAHPGELFVHRNIANMVIANDMSVLSVMQYAVQYLKVKHVIVCGHYGCGGVAAALDRKPLGFIDNWLRNIQDVYRLHKEELDQLQGDAQLRRLIELNTSEQVLNVHKTNFVQDARRATGYPKVHGMVYDVAEGKLNLLKKFDKKAKLEKYGDIYTYTD